MTERYITTRELAELLREFADRVEAMGESVPKSSRPVRLPRVKRPSPQKLAEMADFEAADRALSKAGVGT